MKQKLDEVRTLARELFEAGQKRKRRQPKTAWSDCGRLAWHHLPLETVDIWDAVAKCAIKRLTCLALIAAFMFVPCQRAKAPISVGLALTLKCLTATGIGATAIIIFRCSPDYFLVRYQEDEYAEPHWACSQATEGTLKKTFGRRCEGPWKDRTEPDFRAWVNNKTPNEPMFPCGPLGIIPNATRTNWMRVTLQQSTDGGNSYASVASTVTAFSVDGSDDGYSFAMLPATGTSGMSRAQLDEVAACSVAFTNSNQSALFRASFEETTEPTNSAFWRVLER